MKKNVLIAVLSIISAASLWKLSQVDRKPNNQYELLIFQDHLQLKDGDRNVSTLKWESNPQIDSVIQANNL